MLSADGSASRQEVGEDWRSRTVAWASPACELRRHHPLPINVTADGHTGAPIGQVVGVHRAQGRGGILAYAVAELDAAGADRLLDYPDPIYFSAEIDGSVRARSAINRDMRLLGAALTTTPARLCAQLEPVTLLPGSLRDRSHWSLDRTLAATVDATITQAQLRERHGQQILDVTAQGEQPLAGGRAGIS